MLKILASWSLELTEDVLMKPKMIFSLITWQSNYMCIILSWKIIFYKRYDVGWLSHMSSIGHSSNSFSSSNKCFNHKTSQVACVIERYYASLLDLTTTICFFYFSIVAHEADEDGKWSSVNKAWKCAAPGSFSATKFTSEWEGS